MNQCVDGLVYFGIRIVVMQLPLNPLHRHLPLELNGRHIREPLLLCLLRLQYHLVQLHLCHIIRLMYDQVGIKLVHRQQIIVLVDDLDDLVGVEAGNEVN